MYSLKEKYQRFRRWQQQPFEYHDGHHHHECNNCGNVYENNYCPRCGQKAVYGPITWKSVWKSIMDVWGVGTRSLPHSLWQLLWRPGYLMRDYISGKRQASFPPVKMLVVIAVLLVLANTVFGMDYGNDPNVGTAASLDSFKSIENAFFEWMTNHIAWTVLIVFSLFIIPIWLLFRQAPRLPRHTLPQGFYIQVFIGVQFILLMLMIILLFELIPSMSGNGTDVTGTMVFLVLPAMLLIDYKQLFGYGWWGTIWRALVSLPLMLIVGKVFQYVAGFFYSLFVKNWHDVTMYLTNALGMLTFMWLMFEIVNLINGRFWRGGIRFKMFWRPLLALAAVILTIVVCQQLGYRTPFDIFGAIVDSMSSD